MQSLSEHQIEIRDALQEAAAEFGETVTFTRGSTVLKLRNAVRGRRLKSTDAPFEAVKVGEVAQEWIIEAVALKSDGEILKPQRADLLEVGDESFRVMPVSKDGPLWQWVDRSGKTFMRIFTKERS